MITVDPALDESLRGLGLLLLATFGPMLIAALWVLWDESAWRARFHRNRALRRERREHARALAATRPQAIKGAAFGSGPVPASPPPSPKATRSLRAGRWVE